MTSYHPTVLNVGSSRDHDGFRHAFCICNALGLQIKKENQINIKPKSPKLSVFETYVRDEFGAELGSAPSRFVINRICTTKEMQLLEVTDLAIIEYSGLYFTNGSIGGDGYEHLESELIYTKSELIKFREEVFVILRHMRPGNAYAFATLIAYMDKVNAYSHPAMRATLNALNDCILHELSGSTYAYIGHPYAYEIEAARFDARLIATAPTNESFNQLKEEFGGKLDTIIANQTVLLTLPASTNSTEPAVGINMSAVVIEPEHVQLTEQANQPQIQKTCKQIGCTKKVHGRGLCNTHHKHLLRDAEEARLEHAERLREEARLAEVSQLLSEQTKDKEDEDDTGSDGA